MKILLDTHILLWALSNDARLPVKARVLIENEANEIYYSLVSLWDVEIKRLAHPDAMPVTAEDLAGYCGLVGFQRVPVRERHIFALAGLVRREEAPPHKDPFDRMLICQAATEDMVFATHDPLIPGYDEPCILSYNVCPECCPATAERHKEVIHHPPHPCRPGRKGSGLSHSRSAASPQEASWHRVGIRLWIPSIT